MAKRKTSKKTHTQTDGEYLLKLVLFLILGSLWVKFSGETSQIPLPVGFFIGLVFASHDHFRIDRKIEYALLLVAMLVGFWLPIGIYISM